MAASHVTGFERLLLATDGSEFSAGALRVGLAIGARCGAQVIAVSMVTSNPELDALAPERARQAEEQARAHLRQVADLAQELGVSCEIQVLHGSDPAREIAEAAEAARADLVVMGRRGKRGMARLMVGDATAKVAGQAGCAVLVVPRACELWRRRLLLATDGSRHADRAADAAASLARACGVPVTVVSVIRENFNDSRAAEAQAAVERACERLRREGVSAEGLVLKGQPEELIVITAAERGADLIVMGTRGRTGFARILLGSVAERVIGSANCPVLTLKQ